MEGGYSAVTVNTDNSASASYFNVGLYSDSSCTQTASSMLKTSAEYMTTSGLNTTYSVNDNTDIAADSLYMKIIPVNLSGGTYSVSADCTCTFRNSTQSVSSDSASLSVVLTGESGTVTNPSAETAYKVSLLTSGFSTSGLNSAPTSMSVTVSIIVTNSNMGIFAGSPSSITLTSSSSIVITDDTSAAEALEEANADDNNHYFTGSSDKNSNHSSGKSYSGGYGVTIASSEGRDDETISSGSKISASLNSVDDSFVIILYKGTNGKDGNLHIQVDNGNDLSIPMKGKKGTVQSYIVYGSSNSLEYYKFENNETSGESIDITSIMDGKTWITGKKITVNGQVGSVTMDIVLKA